MTDMTAKLEAIFQN